MTKARSVLRVACSLFAFSISLRFPAHAQETDGLIHFYQQRIARDQENFSHYNALAAAYLQKARETGEISYYDRAEQTLKKSIELVPNHTATATATTYLAAVALAQHRFREAVTTARKALQFDATDPAAHGVLGDAFLELGEYQQATAAYAKLCHRHRGLECYSRLSHLEFLHGKPHAAMRYLKKACTTGTAAHVPKEHRAWLQTQLGETSFSIGRITQADQAYRGALATYPEYHRALAGLGKVRAAQAQYQEAIALYRRAIAVIPLPEYVTTLGDLYTKTGNQEEAQKHYALIEYMGTLNALNQNVYNRELALFHADHDRNLPYALALAQKELESRRDLYTYDVLAWALYKNGQPQAAFAAMQKALQLGTQDARLFFHAGMIALRLKQQQTALRYLARAWRLNPRFHLLDADTLEHALSGTRKKSRSVAATQEGRRVR